MGMVPSPTSAVKTGNKARTHHISTLEHMGFGYELFTIIFSFGSVFSFHRLHAAAHCQVYGGHDNRRAG
jgi:hypothetical protein